MSADVRRWVAKPFAIALFAMATAASGCAAEPAEAPLFPTDTPDVGALSERDLYLFVVDRGEALSNCVLPIAQAKGADSVLKELHGNGRYPKLVEAASSVLGSGHPVVQEARANPRDDAAGVQVIMTALGQFGGNPQPDSMRERLLQSKATYITVLEMAGVIGGRCSVPAGFFEALGRIPPEA